MRKSTKPVCVRPMYALINKTPVGTYNICFRIGTDPKQLWRDVIEEEWLGTGHTKETLQNAGWQMKRVKVTI